MINDKIAEHEHENTTMALKFGLESEDMLD